MPRRQRWAGPAGVTSASRKRTEPAVACSEPASTFSSVVFPAPLGPTMPTASSAPSAKSTSCSTSSAPKRFRTPCAASKGVPLVLTRQVLAVRLQLRRDGDLRVVVVLRDLGLDLELAARLHPLRADDRPVRHRPWDRALGEVHLADRRADDERLERLGDGRLALRIVARLERGQPDLEDRDRGADLLQPLASGRLRVGVGDLLVGHAERRRAIRPCGAPVDGRGEVVPEAAEGDDLGGEQARLRDLRDLHLLCVALLRRLPPEGREVGRQRERVEDLAVLGLELRDLGREVRRAVLVRARVDDGEAGLREQRGERAADRVAVGVVRVEHADLLVRLDRAVPLRDVGAGEVGDAEAEVVRPLERVLAARLGAAAEVPGLPRLHGRDLRDARRLARVGDRVVHLGRRRRQHEVDLAAVDQGLRELAGTGRIGLRVLLDDRDRIGLAADLDALRQRLAELADDPRIRLAERAERAGQRAEEADPERARLGRGLVDDLDPAGKRGVRRRARDEQASGTHPGSLDDLPAREARAAVSLVGHRVLPVDRYRGGDPTTVFLTCQDTVLVSGTWRRAEPARSRSSGGSRSWPSSSRRPRSSASATSPAPSASAAARRTATWRRSRGSATSSRTRRPASTASAPACSTWASPRSTRWSSARSRPRTSSSSPTRPAARSTWPSSTGRTSSTSSAAEPPARDSARSTSRSTSARGSPPTAPRWGRCCSPFSRPRSRRS